MILKWMQQNDFPLHKQICIKINYYPKTNAKRPKVCILFSVLRQLSKNVCFYYYQK